MTALVAFLARMTLPRAIALTITGVAAITWARRTWRAT